MDFTPTDDRRMLADTLNRFLTDRYDHDTRMKIAGSEIGWSAELWAEMAELGLIGALFAEDEGGFGGHGFDIALIFEGLGRALVVEPFHGALAARALPADQREEVIAGALIPAFAHSEPGTSFAQDRLRTTVTDGKLSGTKVAVAQAEAAHIFIVSAQDSDGPALFMVNAEHANLTAYPLFDGGRGADVTFDDAPATRLSAPLDTVLNRALLALSAEALGIMERCKDTTVDYLKTRRQFGIPLSKFQALQHRAVDMVTEIEQTRSAVINAAHHLGGPGASKYAAAAKYTAAATGRMISEEAIQLHGGIAMTWEYDLAHAAKRLTMTAQIMGDEDVHLRRFPAL
ncbi:acyl-CoA dehydrogenase family protein [Pontivivens insulae]|uniref:Flavoprotein desaturase PigA n=1 Tax=Pontivivens insulae TaxID=1639689 RepID=A0A2R8AE10_9RHOB|nr:acyl-CoA dehydrogenase family protein [Pontivivens insulae]RED14416.1 alkylation response protein AidB-like acyl-CoA dehydrogenase [Pontivivens insulae]SPF30493.1 Flavoprotein desaturase PigA [Pontivivens insulae]